MRVANPIYDVVFKFLMGDMRIAKLILSKILDQEIETLEFKPTEFRRKIGLNLTVFRIDFSAVLLQPDGSRKLALIEMGAALLSQSYGLEKVSILHFTLSVICLNCSC